jgi:uncharacterized protein YhbP (UPF0306 family)
MEIPELIKKYLQEPKVMQLATVSGEQPWICTVHFAFDEALNFYWISSQESRHSKELAENSKAAVTIPVKFPEHPVVCVAAEGKAQVLEGKSLKENLIFYERRLPLSDEFKNKLLAGEGNHKLYRIQPILFVLFDEVNFPKDPRREWRPSG